MATSNISYLNTYSVPGKPQLRRAVYTWGLIGFSLVDVILLFWLLNPFAGPSAHHYKLVGTDSPSIAGFDSEMVGPKPSPLGTVVAHKAKSPVRARTVTTRSATQPSF